MQELNLLLSQNAYPGRGIVLGRCKDGNALMAYFIMGRSENSRNRVFIEKDGGIVTQAADPAKVTDPSLIIYAPVRKIDDYTIVTNGVQTDAIYEALQNGGSFASALSGCTFEPDAPHYTPRISGLVRQKHYGLSYCLSILKTSGGNPDTVQRFFYDYPKPLAVPLDGDIDAIGTGIWESLNADNKVSLFVRTITPQGEEQTRIYNKYAPVTSV